MGKRMQADRPREGARDLILSVDDDEGNRYIRTHALRGAGFEVIEASNGTAALELALKRQPALVVLDVHLPDIDGFAVCARLKADPRTRTIPVLHVSAEGNMEQDLPAAFEHESDAYLRDPVSPETLVATAKALIRAHRAERRAADILESTADPVIEFDKYWRLTFVNRHAAEALGKPAGELLGHCLRDLFPRSIFDGFEEACLGAWDENQRFGGERYSTLLGEWVEASIRPSENRALAQWRIVTDRKRAADALLESRTRLELALEAAELGAFEVDLASGAVNASERAYAIFALPESAADLEAWTSRVHPEDRERVEAEWRKAIAIPSRYEMEYRLVHPDGGVRWISDRTAPVFDAGGKPVRLIGVVQDITERRRSEAALRASEERLRLTLDGTGLGTWEYRPATDECFWDAEAKSIFGWPAEAVTTLPGIFERIHPADRAKVRTSLEGSLFSDEPESSLQYRVIWPDGSVHWVQGRSSVLFEGEGGNRRAARVIGIHHDITGRKRMEELLRTSEERLRLTLDATGIGTSEYQPQSGQLFRDEQAGRLLGVEPGVSYEDISGQVHPDDRSRVRESFAAALSPDSSGLWECDYRTVRPDGSVCWLRSSGRVYFENEGGSRKAVRMIGVHFDVTGQKRTEQALRESESRYRGLFESMQEGLVLGEVIRDAADQPSDFRFLDVNPAFERMTGRTRAEVEGQSYRGLFPDCDWQFWAAKLGEVASSRRPSRFEYHSTGTGRHTEVIAFSPAAGQVAAIISDIGERRRAEQALAESEERYRTLFTGMSEGFALGEPIYDSAGTAVDFRFIEANEAFEQQASLSRATLGRSIREVLPNVEPVWIQNYCRVALTGEPIRFEAFNGDTGRHFSVFAYRPSPGRFAILFRDITEIKRAEQAARESESRYRELVENAASAIIRWKRDGTVTFFNEFAESFFGYGAQEVMGRHIGMLVPAHTSTGADLSGLVADLVAHPERYANFENENVCRDGRRVWMAWTNRPILDENGNVAEILAVGSDISRRILAEQNVRHHSAVVEGINRIFSAALACRTEEELAGVCLEAAEQVTQSKFGFVGLINAQNRLDSFAISDPGWENGRMKKPLGERVLPQGFAIHGLYGKVLTTGASLLSNDPPRHPDSIGTPEGHPVLTAFLGSPLKHGDKVIGMIAVGNREGGYEARQLDALEAFAPAVAEVLIRKQAELAVRAGEQRLRQAQKMESIGLLAGGIAHDFNNILTGIMGSASLALEDRALDPAEAMRDVIRGAERAANLTRQLLAYAGKGQFVVRDLDISQAVSEAAELAHFSIPKSVALTLEVRTRLPLVRMDPSQLQQVLMNLVINAGEAIGEGKPGRVTVATSVENVAQPFYDAIGEQVPPGRYVSIVVSDTGIGIPDDARQKLFDPFFTTKFTGRGLGLAAVAGIVRSRKGGITVESTPGRGSTFRVLLPVADDFAQLARRSGTARAQRFWWPMTKPPSGRSSARLSGAAGIAFCRQPRVRKRWRSAIGRGGAIEAAIVDIVMPVMGANELIPLLRKRRPGIRLLLTSGYSEIEALRICAAYPRRRVPAEALYGAAGGGRRRNACSPHPGAPRRFRLSPPFRARDGNGADSSAAYPGAVFLQKPTRRSSSPHPGAPPLPSRDGNGGG